MPRLLDSGPWALLFSIALGACTPSDGGALGETDGCATGCEGDEASDGSADGSDGADGADGSDDGDDDGPAASGIPCEIQQILADDCGECHGDPPIYGAPMSLHDYDAFQVPAGSDVSRSVWEVALERIDDPQRPMPPFDEMATDHRDALRSWLQAGAPRSDEAGTCDLDPVDPGEPVGPDALPCEVTHTFTAHADASTEAFHVPEQGADNLYQCFTFQSPVAEGTQATAWAPIIDDERVVHHWILYRSETPQPDGGVGPCNMPGDAKFVAGWAPGGKNFHMPEGVGLELGGPDDSYILQIHYHNTAHHADSFDATGVAFCTADEPQPQTAGIITLGSVWLDIPPGAEAHDESGVCPSWITSFMPEPLNVIAAFPHMHQLGQSFHTDILRGGSEDAVEPLTDVPAYNFENQEFYAYDPPVQIMPGDAIRTTCTYDNPYDFPVRFGEGTEDEMCFNFVMAHPIEAVGDTRDCGTLDNG